MVAKCNQNKNVTVILFFQEKNNIAVIVRSSHLIALQSEGAGLAAAALISIVPGYISRSVAGSYDNEGIAIFCMLLTYYFWIKAVKTGSIYWAASCALGYFYMVSNIVL